MRSVHTLIFEEIYEYDTLQTGITLPVSIIVGEVEVKVNAKLDTGASHSIFARVHGENLDLDIESGEPLFVSTIREGFRVFGHELTVRFLTSKFARKYILPKMNLCEEAFLADKAGSTA